MAVGYDRGHFWNRLVAPVLFGCWCSRNVGRMAHESQRLLVGVPIFSHRDTALVYHIGRVCFDCADCTPLP